jgi:hypothetical protein
MLRTDTGALATQQVGWGLSTNVVGRAGPRWCRERRDGVTLRSPGDEDELTAGACRVVLLPSRSCDVARVRFDTQEHDRCFEKPRTAASDGVVGMGPQTGAAERQGMSQGCGIVLGDAHEIDGEREPVVVRQRVRQRIGQL